MAKEGLNEEITALTYQPPVVEIAGRKYQLRRLGILDTLRLAKILAAGIAGLGTEVGNLDKMDPQTLGMVLIAGAPYAERQTLEFLAGCINVKAEDLRDPQRFPMGSEIQIIQALVEHEDVHAFFKHFRKLLASPALQALLRSKSTFSRDATAGQMPTS